MGSVAAIIAAQHLHLLGDGFGGEALLAVLVGPLADPGQELA